MAKDTTPLEEFRRVTATTMRAVSRKEVNVSFVPDGGSLLGSEARITVPARDLPVEDVSRVRGEADSMALKLRHHDRKTHLRRVPRGETARAIFEAVEQVRVEALGARRMAGVADNLSALWRQRSDQRGHARIKSKDDAPIADVIGLIAREQLLGAAPPESAKAMVDMWRADVESAAGRDFQKLRESLANQEAFARAARQLIRDLKLGDESADLQDDDQEDSQDQENADGQSNETGDDQSDSSETHGYGAQGEETEDASEQEDASETVADQAQTEMQMGSGDEEEPGRAERPWLPPGALSQRAAGPAVSRLHGEVRRDRRGRPAVRRRGARPPAQPPRPAALAPAGRDRQARQPPAAPPDGAAEPLVGLRPRRGHARRRAPGPHRRQSHARRSPSRRRRTPTSATPWCRC